MTKIALGDKKDDGWGVKANLHKDKDEVVEMYGPIESKGIIGSDKRHYILEVINF